MKVTSGDRSASKMLIVDPKTCCEFSDKVIEADIVNCTILCYEMRTVTDEDGEEREVVVKERDQAYDGPGIRYKWKLYKRFCDFDVVDRETGHIIAEARYMNVTSRI